MGGWWLWRVGCFSQDTYLIYGTVEAIWSNIEQWVLKSWKHELINYWMSNMVLRDASASKNNFFCIEVADHIASLNRFLSLPRPLIPQVVTRDAFWMAEIEEIGGNFNPNTQPAGFYSTKCQESAHLRIQEKKTSFRTMVKCKECLNVKSLWNLWYTKKTAWSNISMIMKDMGVHCMQYEGVLGKNLVNQILLSFCGRRGGSI